MKLASVISVRGKNRQDLERDPDFVYCGRAVRFTDWTEPSEWHNPFSKPASGRSPRDEYELWLTARLEREPQLLAQIRNQLAGKTLGCWCADWSPGDPDIGCHAVILAGLANS